MDLIEDPKSSDHSSPNFNIAAINIIKKSESQTVIKVLMRYIIDCRGGNLEIWHDLLCIFLIKPK